MPDNPQQLLDALRRVYDRRLVDDGLRPSAEIIYLPFTVVDRGPDKPPRRRKRRLPKEGIWHDA